MDLSETALRFAAAGPHPLLAVAPGFTNVRVAVERALRERAWPEAGPAAEADMLVICGLPGPQLADAIDKVWSQMPAPRARAVIVGGDGAGAALEIARTHLADVTAQRREAAGRRKSDHERHVTRAEQDEDEHRGHDHGSHQPEDEHGQDDGGHGDGGEHEGDGGHEDHEEGTVVAGVPLASRAPDRDGLKLDRLHVPLGPILPDWPPGLVVRTALQGDVVQEVEALVVDSGGHACEAPFWDEPWLRAAAGERVSVGEAARRRAASHLDSLGRLLAVAGWEAAAAGARRLRDDLLAGAAAREVAPRLSPLARRVRRSRLLRWSLSGLGLLEREMAIGHGVGGPALRAGGDVWARLLQWLAEAEATLAELDRTEPLAARDGAEGPRGPVGEHTSPSRALLELLPSLLVGGELAGARLVVASLDPDPDQLLAEEAGTHG